MDDSEKSTLRAPLQVVAETAVEGKAEKFLTGCSFEETWLIHGK
jgi:hypothetical protein